MSPCLTVALHHYLPCTQVLLPDNRHLKHFDQQPLAALPEGKEGARYLLWWYLEDQVKVRDRQRSEDIE
jgi:hypothetical protein